MASLPAHLDPSELGTKQYWDSAYALELANHSQSTAATSDGATAESTEAADEGTIWFSDAGAEEKVLAYLESHEHDLHVASAAATASTEVLNVRSSATFLDLGTGNGHMLFALREEGWTGRLVGVDYSEASVELCEQILASRRQARRGHSQRQGQQEQPLNGVPSQDKHQDEDEDDESEDEDEGMSLDDIHFARYDILNPSATPLPPSIWPSAGFDVVLDKGTFDAVSLSSPAATAASAATRLDHDGDPPRAAERYAERIEPLLAPGGLLLVTSCNWTRDEVCAWFERPGGSLRVKDAVAYPTFTFGGRSGSKVCSVCFEKVADE